MDRFREAFGRHGFKTGFLKLTLLKLISVEPCHGFALMTKIERLTGGDWRPSPGSVYPALRELERKGLVKGGLKGRQKIYTLTPDGWIVLDQALGHLRMVMRHMRSFFPEEDL